MFLHGLGSFLDFFVSFKEKFFSIFFVNFHSFCSKNVEKIDAWMEIEITLHLLAKKVQGMARSVRTCFPQRLKERGTKSGFR